MEREAGGDPARGWRVTLLERGPRWRVMSLVAGVLVVAAAAVAVTLWLTDRQGRTPEQTARQFLEATTCRRLHTLADDTGDAHLGAKACDSLVDAAEGRRTYGDAAATHDYTRRLFVGGADVTGDRAEVTVIVSYTEGGTKRSEERMGVVLVKDDQWLVHAWGLVE